MPDIWTFDFTTRQFFQLLAGGLLLGGTYALLSLGLGLIFGVMNVINFAQGEFMMLAMFMAFLLFTGPLHIDPLITAVLAIPVFFLVGVLAYEVFLSRVTGRRGAHESQLIMTLGLAIVMQNVTFLIFDPTPRQIRTNYTTDAFLLADIFINKAQTYTFAAALVVAMILFLILRFSRVGKALRATSEDWEASTYMGINIRHMHRLAWGMGIALTGTAGALLATFQVFDQFIGFKFIVIMYVAVILGGLGSITGAFVGGLLIGVIQSMSQLFIALGLQNLTHFLLFLLILYFRPRGLFGRRTRAV